MSSVGGTKRALMVGGAIAVLASACNPFASPLVDACEEALKKRLLAPSTYRRVNILIETQAPISFHDYVKTREESAAVRELRLKMGGKAYRGRAIIEYDAANAFGAPLRHQMECTFDFEEGEGVKAAKWYSVKIDGKSNVDYLRDSISRTAPSRREFSE